jgi:NADPH:quinone reductase-like Zn-dependent oxidoreductase
LNSNVKALQLVAHGTPGKFDFHEVPEPVPSENEAVVDVRACGLNHLDLWLEAAGLPIKIELPRTPGGEVAGIISKVGSALQHWQIGDRVAVQSNIFCGRCEFCTQGEESMCLSGLLLGVHRNGGFAERVAVPETALVRLPDNVSFETAAAITLAGSTAMHMLTDRTQVQAGEWVLVIGGASGVGSAAIQIACSLGARVISTGSTPEKRALAHRLGAIFTVDTMNPAWPAEVRRITGKRGVDAVIEHVGGEVLVKCFDCLARNGRIITCGATAERRVTLNLWPLFVKQQRLIGSYGRNRKDMRSTLEWAATGRLQPIIHATFPLSRAVEAFALLRERRVLGKLVIANE